MAVNRKKAASPVIRMTGVWVFLLSLFIIELLFYTWCRVQCVQVGIVIGQETRKAEELETLQKSLKIELARLKAPERISHIAKTQLRLEMPEPRQVVLLP